MSARLALRRARQRKIIKAKRAERVAVARENWLSAEEMAGMYAEYRGNPEVLSKFREGAAIQYAKYQAELQS